jgi:hypothetical protein
MSLATALYLVDERDNIMAMVMDMKGIHMVRTMAVICRHGHDDVVVVSIPFDRIWREHLVWPAKKIR